MKHKIIGPRKKLLTEGNEDDIEIAVQLMEKYGVAPNLKEIVDDTASRIFGKNERCDALAERLWTLFYEDGTELQKGAESTSTLKSF